VKLKLTPSLEWLLVFVPVALALRFVPSWHNDTALFICSGLAIIPLAGLMGKATEHLAEKLGPGIGGLLNATFGNAAELIIALLALQKGLFGVVKASLTGSILGNILLVFGASALAGGIKHKHLKFNRRAVQTSTTSLMLAAIGLLIPTVFHYAAASRPGGWNRIIEERLSLAIAVVLFGTYLCTLIFSLMTHRQMFNEAETHSSEVHPPGQLWSRTKAVLVLFVATAFVALLSEFLVGSVEAARTTLGVTEVFIGIIIVAIIGNAAEHSTAVWMAMRNKMDLSMGIAIGSSLQIALFVAPLLVFVSYLFGQPMDLEFSVPEIVGVIVAVHIAAEISNDGETNWLEGVQLLSVYVILAILFYFLPATH
jgi:Ca2+:H+ antiporter